MWHNDKEFEGKVVALIGGRGFIGSALAKAYKDAGAKVIVVDLAFDQSDESSRIESPKFYEIDFSQRYRAIDTLRMVSKNHDIDIVINLVAFTKFFAEERGLNYFAPFSEYDPELMAESLKVNLESCIISCQVFGKAMLERGGGTIINFASDVGVFAPNDNIYESDETGYAGVPFNTPTVYAVSKSGIVHLTKVLGAKWASKNVRVNCISPAGVDRNQQPGFKKKLLSLIPMGRMLTVEELIGPTFFLSSSSSSFIVGQNLMVDGGRSLW